MLKIFILASIVYFAVIHESNAYIRKPAEPHSVSPSDMYSIVATPIHGNRAYILALYVDEDKTESINTAARPLDGDIIDIIIRDIDDDGQEELIVAMQEKRLELNQIHFDVFEFEGNRLYWVEDFSNLKRLLSLFSSSGD
jgi:hypothetical protein